MKIPQKKSHKLLLFVTGLVVIAILASGFYWWLKQRSATQNGATKPATSQERQDSAAAKQNDLNAQSNSNATNNTGSSTVPGTGSGSGGTQQIPLAVTITRAGQVGGAGQPVSVRTLVNGTTTGTCTMVFSQAGQPNITKTYNITFQATSSTCNADIPASDFSANGAWQLSVTATSGSSTSAAATWNLTVTK